MQLKPIEDNVSWAHNLEHLEVCFSTTISTEQNRAVKWTARRALANFTLFGTLLLLSVVHHPFGRTEQQNERTNE